MFYNSKHEGLLKENKSLTIKSRAGPNCTVCTKRILGELNMHTMCHGGGHLGLMNSYCDTLVKKGFISVSKVLD